MVDNLLTSEQITALLDEVERQAILRSDHRARLCAAVRQLQQRNASLTDDCATVENECAALREQLADGEARIEELERRLRIPFGKLPCAQCGGPHDFDTSLPSVVWNQVIRAKGLPEYLCTTCIVREFVRANQGFTASLWNEEFNGVNIEVVVEGQNAKDAALIQDENNDLRNQLATTKCTTLTLRFFLAYSTPTPAQ